MLFLVIANNDSSLRRMWLLPMHSGTVGNRSSQQRKFSEVVPAVRLQRTFAVDLSGFQFGLVLVKVKVKVIV